MECAGRGREEGRCDREQGASGQDRGCGQSVYRPDLSAVQCLFIYLLFALQRSFIRNFLMYGLHTVLRIVGVGHIRDTQCGFKLFTRAAAQQIFPNQHLTTWIFDVELLLLAKQLGIPVEEVPIEWHEVPGSKLNVMKDSLHMLRDLLVLRANMLLGRWKIGLKAKAE